jgi:hypothetical protein
MTNLVAALILSLSQEEINVDCDFPGGNIIVDKIEGNTVSVHQDLRDTSTKWFYWQFRVRGAQGRTVTFQFTTTDAVGVLGPAMSLDAGESWSWLGRQSVKGNSFQVSFPAEAKDVRFCVSIPYLEKDLKKFLARHESSPNLKVETHCETPKGRKVERLRLGRLDGSAETRILVTARHHACEMIASYVLEGILKEALSDPWYREKVELAAVPFMDKDGVEDGDQGKNRKPRDHNRDYSGESLYASTGAMREFVPRWSAGKLKLALDLHCPTLRGPANETTFFVGSQDEVCWKKILRLSELFETGQTNPGMYRAKDNMPFGTGFNKPSSFTTGSTFSRWARSLPESPIGTTLEVSYANSNGVTVTADSARTLGRDLAKAIRKLLE